MRGHSTGSDNSSTPMMLMTAMMMDTGYWPTLVTAIGLCIEGRRSSGRRQMWTIIQQSGANHLGLWLRTEHGAGGRAGGLRGGVGVGRRRAGLRREGETKDPRSPMNPCKSAPFSFFSLQFQRIAHLPRGGGSTGTACCSAGSSGRSSSASRP